MKILVYLLFVLSAVSTTVIGQDMAVGLRVRPGDPVRLVVKFKSAVSPQSAMARFQLNGAVPKDQGGFTVIFDLQEVKKISDTEYELTGKVPSKIASGQFRLDFIIVSVENVSKRYNAGQDFPANVTIDVSNDDRSSFPEIDSVRVLAH